ncbi:inositol monophosphatase family protein [Rhodanobacter sp. MP1X3]|uniref:inositol monophosphatase family protein n=1 Tax=Rhodanobacter sp. MP1X3 TaxID=2723086 RepID=UPI0017BF3005|nr:inositol monophosphatase family protein [Rhodanobacter sp. MP1X3]MBB6242885.1 myo-inositol-1(or 4)-monophosphatase [Rhodanobacter sp. MP1X3]
MIDLYARLQAAITLVEKGGDIARRYFSEREQLTTTYKGLMDFASDADTTVERFVRDEIDTHFPGEAVVGEELGGELCAHAWVVDPIDGTGNFLRGSPLWGVAVAYIADTVPVIGAIRYPALDMTVAAGAGLGFFLNGVQIERKVPFPDVRIAAIGTNPMWATTQSAALEAELKRRRWSVTGYRCATIGMGFAALGHVDGYFEDYTNLWDVAAGMVLCREAGLIVDADYTTRRRGVRIAVGTEPLMRVAGPLWSKLSGECCDGHAYMSKSEANP